MHLNSAADPGTGTVTVRAAAVILASVLFSAFLSAGGIDGPGLSRAVSCYDCASNLAGGRGLTMNFVPHYLHRPARATGVPGCSFDPPGMPALFAAIFRMAGAPSTHLVQWLNFFFCFLLGLATWMVGRQLFDDTASSLYAAVFVVLCPLVQYHSLVCDGVLALAFLANVSLLLLSYERSTGDRRLRWAAMVVASICPYVEVYGLVVPLAVLASCVSSNLASQSRRPGEADMDDSIDPASPPQSGEEPGPGNDRSSPRTSRVGGITRSDWRGIFLLAAVWLVMQAPWAARNLLVFGQTDLSPAFTTLGAGGHGFFFRYGQSPAHLWSTSSAVAFAGSRLSAVIVLFSRLFFSSTVHLFPFALVALCLTRLDARHRPFVLYLLLHLSVIPFFFASISCDQRFTHSPVVLYPYLACLGMYTAIRAMRLVTRKAETGNFDFIVSSAKAAQCALPMALVLVTGMLLVHSSYSPVGIVGTFRSISRFYGSISSRLDDMGVGEDAVLMTNDPALLYFHCGRPAIPIPGDPSPSAIAAALSRYDARYLVVVHFADVDDDWKCDSYRLDGLLLEKLSPPPPSSVPGPAGTLPAHGIPALGVIGYDMYEIFRQGGR